ncbi:MAG: hypothetical protein ACREDY_11360 [Bradyrhizobium sp.]
MFQLAESRGSRRGVYCGRDGVQLGPSPLIEQRDGMYVVRAGDEIAALLAAAYDQPPDAERLSMRLGAIAEDLQRGDLGQAMISAVLLGLGELSDEAAAHLADADRMLKFNFNQNELRDPDGRWARDGMITPVRAGKPARSRPAAASRAWERQPNADFRNRLAIAEGNADKPNFGYREVRASNGALGRYQILPDSLRAIGITDANGRWTGKYGVHSRTQFLANPEAQEKALGDFLNETERQLRANGAFAYVRRTINGHVAPFSVSSAGLIAAGHRAGASRTLRYLERVEASGFSSRGLSLDQLELAIETRLRTFADARYE